jgi:hypothetical protein
MEFCRQRNGKCTADEVLALISRREDADKGAIHNAGTIALTLAIPQSDPRGLIVRQPQAQTGADEFVRLEV